MIECTEKNIWYKKHRKGKFKRCFSIFLAFLIVFGVIFYYQKVVVNQIFKICSDYAYSFSTESVNQAVLSSLSNGVKYTDLVSVKENNNGDIVLMTSNSYKINLLSREIIRDTSGNLTQKLNEGIPIPILTFFGFQVLSGYGKDVKVKTCSVSAVKCEFFSKFISVGINQTLHSIYIKVISDIKVSVPLNNKTITCETEVLISETVLVGKVPEIYLNGKLFS